LSFLFLISCLLPEIFAIKVGSCEKSVQILHGFGPKFFRGGPPEFLDLDYLFRVDNDHAVKFRGDWPRELGDPMYGGFKKNVTTKTEGLPELTFRAA